MNLGEEYLEFSVFSFAHFSKFEITLKYYPRGLLFRDKIHLWDVKQAFTQHPSQEPAEIVLHICLWSPQLGSSSAPWGNSLELDEKPGILSRFTTGGLSLFFPFRGMEVQMVGIVTGKEKVCQGSLAQQLFRWKLGDPSTSLGESCMFLWMLTLLQSMWILT